MEILRKDEVPSNYINGSSEVRWYYESPVAPFRVVVTNVPSGHVQNEHRHKYLTEIVYVTQGRVDVSERRNGSVTEVTLGPGDMVCFSPPHFHNMANRSAESATTVTIKLIVDERVAPGQENEIFKTDWIGYGDS